MMIIRQTLILSASFAAASVDALILNPSASTISLSISNRNRRRNTIRPLRALNDYDGRPSYRRQEGSKNRFNVRSTNNYNNNLDNEEDAYAMARELASRRGLNLSSSPSRGYNNNGPPPPNIPMDYYTADPPVYGSDYVGISAQELPMDYNSNNNNNFNYNNDNYGNNGSRGGGGLRDLSSSWGGSKGQNGNNNYDAGRYELRIVKEAQRSNNGNRDGQWYKPQPPRQPPREVRQSDYRERRNDRLSMGRSQRSIGRAQSSMGRRTSYEQDRRLEYRQPPKGQGRSNSNSAFSLESNKVNKLQELASTSTRMDSLRFMPQYPAPNAQYRQNIPYIEPPPFRPPTTTPGFASTSEQMRRSGSSTQQPFMSPPPQYSQIYQSSQQQRRPPPGMRPPSVSLSELALQPHIQPKDDKPSQQQQLQDMYQHDPRQWQQQQQQPQQQPQQQWRPPSYIEGQNQSAPSTPLSFQQMSQADFTRPFQGTGGAQQNQQQSSAPGGAGPPPDFNGGPPPFEQGGPPPPFGQGPPPPPFGPDVHIFQNPFMNEPMFQEPRAPAQSKSTDSNIKVPKDPNTESTRRRAAATNNPGSGMKIPKDPILERKRKQESKDQSDDGMKVPRDPFLERKKQKVDTSTASSKSSGNNEVRVPKEPNMKQKQQNERRPKEPKPKTSSQNNMRVPREPTVNAQKDRIPKEPPRRNGSSNVGKSNVVGKEEDLTYEDFASFFDMPKL